MPIRVMHFGLGPIGAAVVRQVAERKGFIPVGGIDIDPAKVGKDLGEVAGLKKKLRAMVSDDPARAIKETKPDIVVLCTNSSLKAIMPQLKTILECKVPVVSTTEELAYPQYSNSRLTRKIDEMAKKANVAVVGTGVNPGFVMDALPIALTGVCERVDRVRVDRIQDARHRRLPFQQKIGAGLTRAEFKKKYDEGRIRHVGFTESIAMIASAFGWKLDKVTDVVKPKMANEKVSSKFMKVEKGQVCGIVQDAKGFKDGKTLIHLHMEAYLGAPESYDATTIAGSPRLYSKVEGGVHGDIATVSMTVNTIPKVLKAHAGLRTMRDLRLPSYFGGK